MQSSLDCSNTMFSQIDFDVSSLTLYCTFQKFLFQLDFDYYQTWHFLSLILIFNSTSRNTNIDHALPLCSDQTNPISFVYVDHKQKSMLQFVSLLITTFSFIVILPCFPFYDLTWFTLELLNKSELQFVKSAMAR